MEFEAHVISMHRTHIIQLCQGKEQFSFYGIFNVKESEMHDLFRDLGFVLYGLKVLVCAGLKKSYIWFYPALYKVKAYWEILFNVVII